ncbi:MAG: aconitate hydratase AcnA [Nitrospirae bacterium]|nr:aconitate hydratase AcnA [Nitrospirota bacterium]
MERFGSKGIIEVEGKRYTIFRLKKLEEKGIANISRLPFSIRVLAENLLRNMDASTITEENVREIVNWKRRYDELKEIAYYPSRVILQDFTGVPCVVDLAAMRDAMAELGGDPMKINPLVPVDLIIDHSVQVDHYGTSDSITKNMEMEYKRNVERYTLLKWAQKSFKNMRVFPPGSGIIHQVNLEHISKAVMTEEKEGEVTAFPDTVIGTDSHTTMINGLGVLGWGVGGIEAEAVMLGQPYYMTIPEVIGVRLSGVQSEGTTATDLALTITEFLRKHKVVGKFVEFFGKGVKSMSLADRAMLANMAPEYGATTGFFPVDEETIAYLRLTGRGDAASLAEAYSKEQGLFYYGTEEPEYSEVLEFDISKVVPSVAGPSRPQDRLPLNELKKSFMGFITSSRADKSSPPSNNEAWHNEGGGCKAPTAKKEAVINIDSHEIKLSDGAVAIAAITSCTSTSNPSVMIGAGLLAKKAVEKGLSVSPHVKTSLAPGSGVVEEYLQKSGLLSYLENLGFYTVGFGCTTCIGNSGSLHPEIEKAVKEKGLILTSVLSGNRNFEARIHQSVKANYLASPALVVALALAGRVDIDLTKEPLGMDKNNKPIYLKDIWPSRDEINETMNSLLTASMFTQKYASALDGDKHWQSLPAPSGSAFKWDEDSTYIKKPPFFIGFSPKPEMQGEIKNARALLVLGDSVTTDHISPAGSIPKEYPAGRYLSEHGVTPKDFNTYGSRRGNHEVMMRGTFANVRIKNKLAAKEGGYTLKLPEQEERFVFDASMSYLGEGVPLIVLAGNEYGTGSSRDWAAKGTHLFGIKAVIAGSYERIHRSNLVGMGVLPLTFRQGASWQDLGLTGKEKFSINGIVDITPGKVLKVEAVKEDGAIVNFEVTARLDTGVEVEYFKHGGILPFVLRKLSKM